MKPKVSFGSERHQKPSFVKVNEDTDFTPLLKKSDDISPPPSPPPESPPLQQMGTEERPLVFSHQEQQFE